MGERPPSTRLMSAPLVDHVSTMQIIVIFPTLSQSTDILLPKRGVRHHDPFQPSHGSRAFRIARNHIHFAKMWIADGVGHSDPHPPRPHPRVRDDGESLPPYLRNSTRIWPDTPSLVMK